MYCGKCGQGLPDDARFCDSCGNAIGTAVQSTPKEQPASAVSSVSFGEDNNQALSGDSSFGDSASPIISVRTPPPGSGKKKVIIGAILAIVLAVGGFFGWKNLGTEARVEKKLDLAVKYLSENNYEQAILAFNEAIKIDNKDVKAYQGLARTYTLGKKYSEAKSTYERGIAAAAPDKKQILQLGLAGMYIDQGNLSEGQSAYQRIIDEDPSCSEAYRQLAYIYNQSKDKQNAKQCLEKGAGFSQDYRLFNDLALAYYSTSNKDKAQDAILKSLTLQIHQQEAFELLNRYYNADPENLVKLGDEYIKKGSQLAGSVVILYTFNSKVDPSGAINYIEKLPQNLKDDISMQIIMAQTYLGMGKTEPAFKVVQAINTDKIKDPNALAKLARLYLLANNKEQARALAERALQTDDQVLEAYSVLNQSYLAENQALASMWRTKYLMFGSSVSLKQSNDELNKYNVLKDSGQLIRKITFDEEETELRKKGLTKIYDGTIKKYNLSMEGQGYLDTQNNIAYVEMFFNQDSPRFLTNEGIAGRIIDESLYLKPLFVRVHNPTLLTRDGKIVIAYGPSSHSATWIQVIAMGPPLETHFKNAGISLEPFTFIDVPELKK
ncbi:MAG: tetratricopeptide repeat protein [Syntrophomonadaceae bacterium]